MDAFIGKSIEGVVTSWNGGATKMFGYGKAEMVGKLAGSASPMPRSALTRRPFQLPQGLLVSLTTKSSVLSPATKPLVRVKLKTFRVGLTVVAGFTTPVAWPLSSTVSGPAVRTAA